MKKDIVGCKVKIIAVLVIMSYALSCKNRGHTANSEIIEYFKGTDTIRERYNVGKNNVREGAYTAYYKSGNPSCIKSYRNDTLHGWAKYFAVDGHVSVMKHYVMGKADGMSLEYYDEGVIKEIGRYRQGRKFMSHYSYYPSGLVKDYLFYDFDGDLKYSSTYDIKGHLLKETGGLESYYDFSPKPEQQPWLYLGDSLQVDIIGPLPPHLIVSVTKYQSDASDARKSPVSIVQHPYEPTRFFVRMETDEFQYWIIDKDYYHKEKCRGRHDWFTLRFEVRAKGI
ncbi:toxin-antitoxin system YwqK family antitoxin [Chitinophaga lutea]